jgi:shikimate kinase
VGYRGSGKTSVGRELARALGCGFADTDRLVEEEAGKSIARLFAEDGEAAFRARESAALDAVLRRARAGERLVVATGGGVVLAARNTAAMREAGTVVWLSAPAVVLGARIAADPGSASSRPALRGATATGEVEAVLKEREPLYRAAAHLEVSTAGLRDEEAARRVLLALGDRQR